MICSHWRTRPTLLGSSLAVLAAFAGPVAAEEPSSVRIALVVGVGNYSAIAPLRNPRNDARAVAAEFWASGYEVFTKIDPGVEELRAEIRVMLDRLRPGAHVAIFFAGHGIQIGGENYLLASDVAARGASLEAVLAGAISANDLVQAIAETGATLSVMIFDACRENPLASDEADGLTAPGGLVDLAVPIEGEFLIAYPTLPNRVALDGPSDGHSPFTEAFVRHVGTPGLEIGQLFRRVRADVREATNGQQLVHLSLSLEGEYYFRSEEMQPDRGSDRADDTAGRPPPEAVVEDAFWISTLARGQRADFEEFLELFPDGRHRREAEARLAAADEPRDVRENSGVPTLGLEGPHFLSTGTAARLQLPVEEPEGLSATVLSLPEGIALAQGDGDPLEVGDRLDGDDLLGLRYELGNEALGDLGALELELTAAEGTAREEVPLEGTIDACDMLAGYEFDPHRVGRGVRLELIDIPLALEACHDAVVRYPDTPRLAALLGRVYRAAEEYGPAKEWNDRAIAAEYPIAICAEGKMRQNGFGGPVDYAGAREHFLWGIALGLETCKMDLGELYQFGLGVKPDPERGIDLIREAAAAGSAWARTLLGRTYENGLGVEPSAAEAARWYLEAANMGDMVAKMHLADLYREGRGVPRDPERAYQWYASAAGQGAAFAQARFARLLAEGELGTRDPKAALVWYERAAEQGFGEARLQLANALIEGDGTEPDPERALELLRTSAADGYARSLARLADLHAEGRVVPENKPEARSLYRQALALGYAPAARPLARLHLEAGEGAEAVAALEGAVAEGDTWAMRDLARLVARGEGTAQDPARAAALVRAAAEGGNAFARRDLARNLESGFGETADPAAAFATMEMAASADVAWARLDLARYYREGIGTEADPVAAAYWLAETTRLADASAAEAAREQLAAVEPRTCLAAIGLTLERRGLLLPGSREDLAERALAALARLGRQPGPDTDLCAELIAIAGAL